MMLVIVTAVLTGVPARGELPPRSPPDSIRRLIDLVQLAWLEPDVTCAQFASTDPSGRGDDHGHFRKLSGRQAVLAEMTGPGVIVRIWSANPQGRLRLFLDGEAAPRRDAPFADVLAGSTPPFVAPLAAHQGGGWVSYLPIPYARSCRVEVGDLEHPGELYYHIQYLSYPAGTPMRSFTTAASSADARDRDEVLARWQNPAESPIARAAGDRDETRDAMLAPGASLALAEAEGKGAVLGCRIAPGSTEPDVLRGLVLRASFDAQPEPTVLAPIGDFFGVGFGVTPYRSLALGWSETGGYTFLPMPFYERARLSLENHSARPVRVHTSVWLRPLAELPPGFGTFHAEFRAVDRVGPELYQFASMSGPGKYVGATFTLQGVGDLWYLEGNEQLVRDGESRPAIVGTGTEDFFNGGWYWDSGPFAAPLWGLGRKEEWTTNRTTPWRIQIPDAVPYRTSLVAQIEHGSANAVRDAAYASVAFGDGAPQPVRALEPQALALPRLWVKRRKDALAAASLPWTPPLAPAALCRFEDLAPDLRASEWPLHQAFPVSYLDTAERGSSRDCSSSWIAAPPGSTSTRPIAMRFAACSSAARTDRTQTC
ncbi:MAG: glycoside hydrolase family 172 protein [Planctomycetota bacterium]